MDMEFKPQPVGGDYVSMIAEIYDEYTQNN